MIRILVVEDEKAISDLIRLNLMKAGYQCVCVYNGMKAADLLETENFDLIILDVMLPELNGFELMEYIRPMGIPVICKGFPKRPDAGADLRGRGLYGKAF